MSEIEWLRYNQLGSVFARSIQGGSILLDNVATSPVSGLDASGHIFALRQHGEESTHKGITLNAQNKTIFGVSITAPTKLLGHTIPSLVTYSTIGIHQLFLGQHVNGILRDLSFRGNKG